MLNNNKQRGLTLIELMLAMVIGLILISGILTVYLGSKKSYTVRDQVSLMEENARAALHSLTRHIEHAGYASDSGMLVNNYIIPTSVTPTAGVCSNGDANIQNTAILQDTDDAVAGDTIGVGFYSDERVLSDCTESNLPAECRVDQAPDRQATMIYNTFLVGDDADNIPTLYCAGSLNSVRQPLAQGVENIQFRYGVDTDDDGAVNQYMNASDIQAGAMWERIMSVQVAILVRSLNPVFPENEIRTYELLDVTQTKNDRYKRAVYTTTVRLRNV